MYDLQTLAEYISIPLPASWERCYYGAIAQYKPDWLNAIDFISSLDYYDIPKQYYTERFQREICLLKSDKPMNFICWLMHYILFYGNRSDILDVWRWGNGCDQPFLHHGSPTTCVVALLAGQPIHRQNMSRLNYDEEQIARDKLGIRSCWRREHEVFGIDGISFGIMAWGSYYMRGNLVSIGRLQFEYGLKSAERESSFAPNACCVYLHVPAGDNGLKEEAVKRSLKKASCLLPQYYPELAGKKIVYCIHSWLLSPQLAQILPPDSNIMKFQNLFTITDYYEGTSSFLTNIFQIKNGKGIDFADLPEDTKLRREIKTYLLQSKPLQNGSGYLIWNEDRKNCQCE